MTIMHMRHHGSAVRALDAPTGGPGDPPSAMRAVRVVFASLVVLVLVGTAVGTLVGRVLSALVGLLIDHFGAGVQ